MTRDFVGYGPEPPHAQWPGDARIAVNFVINFEEGSELSHPSGDGVSEGGLTELALTVRNQAQPFLRVSLPPGATLLSAEVAGEGVKPVTGADGTRIPLLRPGFRPAGCKE